MSDADRQLVPVAPAQGAGAILRTYEDVERAALAAAQSGFFAGVAKHSQAIVKVLKGQELGIGPVTAVQEITIVKGKLSLSAALVAALVKRSGRYSYRVRQMDDQGCSIEWYENGELIGDSSFRRADAERAGLLERGGMYEKYPRNMYWSRAITNGARWHCPDVFAGPVYTAEELGDETSEPPVPSGAEPPAPAPVERKPRATKAKTAPVEQPAEIDADTAGLIHEVATSITDVASIAENNPAAREEIAAALDAAQDVSPVMLNIAKEAILGEPDEQEPATKPTAPGIAAALRAWVRKELDKPAGDDANLQIGPGEGRWLYEHFKAGCNDDAIAGTQLFTYLLGSGLLTFATANRRQFEVLKTIVAKRPDSWKSTFAAAAAELAATAPASQHEIARVKAKAAAAEHEPAPIGDAEIGTRPLPAWTPQEWHEHIYGLALEQYGKPGGDQPAPAALAAAIRKDFEFACFAEDQALDVARFLLGADWWTWDDMLRSQHFALKALLEHRGAVNLIGDVLAGPASQWVQESLAAGEIAAIYPDGQAPAVAE